jgi:hypothetical protein
VLRIAAKSKKKRTPQKSALPATKKKKKAR